MPLLNTSGQIVHTEGEKLNVKASEVINELKPIYKNILEIMGNKEYSQEQKEDLVRQNFERINEKIKEYMLKKK